MDKKDLEKIIRIADSVRHISSLTAKLPANDNRLNGTAGRYKAYYELITPIIERYFDYQLEFQALPKAQDVAFGTVTSAFIAFSSFLDSIIKQETLGSRIVIEKITKEFFIEDNKPFTAYKAVSDIVSKATTSLKIVDNFLEAPSLEFFFGVNTKVTINILTKVPKPTPADFKVAHGKFLKEWGGTALDVKTTKYFHDRFIIIDDMEVWHLGPSLNAFGIKPAMISNIQDKDITKAIIDIFNREWGTASSI